MFIQDPQEQKKSVTSEYLTDRLIDAFDRSCWPLQSLCAMMKHEDLDTIISDTGFTMSYLLELTQHRLHKIAEVLEETIGDDVFIEWGKKEGLEEIPIKASIRRFEKDD